MKKTKKNKQQVEYPIHSIWSEWWQWFMLLALVGFILLAYGFYVQQPLRVYWQIGDVLICSERLTSKTLVTLIRIPLTFRISPSKEQ